MGLIDSRVESPSTQTYIAPVEGTYISRGWINFLAVFFFALPLTGAGIGYFITRHSFLQVVEVPITKEIPGPVQMVEKVIEKPMFIKSAFDITNLDFLGSMRVMDGVAVTVKNKRAAIGDELNGYTETKDIEYQVFGYRILDNVARIAAIYDQESIFVVYWEVGSGKPPKEQPGYIKVKAQHVDLVFTRSDQSKTRP